MESYWSQKKNTIPGMMKDTHNYNPALIPYEKNPDALSEIMESISLSIKQEKNHPEKSDVYSNTVVRISDTDININEVIITNCDRLWMKMKNY